MKCSKCSQEKENIVGDVCFDCFASDEKEMSRKFKMMTIDMLKNAMEKGPPKPKVELFEESNQDKLKEKLETFFETVNNIISVSYTVFAGRYCVMVVYV
jgi:hypothetical protein